MNLPSRLVVREFQYFTDGGTIYLWCESQTGNLFQLILVQHAFPQQSPTLNLVPGRLYFGGTLVPIRSELESAVLRLLHSAEYQCAPDLRDQKDKAPSRGYYSPDIREVILRSCEENCRAFVASIIAFVESPQYLSFADRVEQATDSTRYTVWLDFKPEDQKKAIVRLASFRNIGIPAARTWLEQGNPIANDQSALDVAELQSQYKAAGLLLRTEPMFRWPVNPDQ